MTNFLLFSFAKIVYLLFSTIVCDVIVPSTVHGMHMPQF